MLNKILIKNGKIINEGKILNANIYIEGEYIKAITSDDIDIHTDTKVIDAKGMYILPGVIDDQVHFRDPGLTHKGDIYTESKAAIAGGITSFFEMPNTKPQTITQELLKKKFEVAAQKSLANFSFYIGATNDNIDELLETDSKNVCGIKVFMGSSTGNMLVDDLNTLIDIFSKSEMLIATHCEDETTIQNNISKFKNKFGNDIPVKYHPVIRSEEACYKSSSLAVELAKRYNTRLHVLHLSTAKELSLFSNELTSSKKRITAEVCVHHLRFDDNDYDNLGPKIKWNPAIKTTKDRKELFNGLFTNKIDVIATDHAPHTISEKEGNYFESFSGGPMVQHSLVNMLEFWKKGEISLEKIVEKMSHSPADIFKVNKRGYIRSGYFADITIIDPNQEWIVTKDNILYKCGWSPVENMKFSTKVTHTIVNGHHIYNDGVFDETKKGKAVQFNR